MPILSATFNTAWASVDLIVDGALWTSSVDTITITRSVAGEVDTVVRGVSSRPVVGGSYVGTDSEAPLESSVTYKVDGYLGSTFVATATVTVSTTGAEWGAWLKVPGLPNMTVRANLARVGARTSQTRGGVYMIAGGGGAVSQSAAHWSGIDPDTVAITLEAITDTEVTRLTGLLAYRVLLIQTGAPAPFPAGYYFVKDVAIDLLSPLVSASQTVQLSLVRTGMPAGSGAGIAGSTWAALKDARTTWTAVLAAKATWFDVLKGV